ncbi:NAD(P)/FAD-dependent oxidoreductase [Parvularcula lutaonensis]|uniref:NAD(P)/FAD-dependent oxidoreductase n=1 Tax=Parvularcula lutaonensis TaxID=491923 RepID=A0ABV7MD81_9PROT|nr:FAD-dependent oxidoreductase [Parvularcula lutaonensis]
MAFDVAIIGAGIIGSCTAYRLAARGMRVLWVGDGREGSTVAAAGMLSPSYEHAHEAGAPPFQKMLDEGLRAWERFAREVSGDPQTDLGYRLSGVYGIGFHARPPGSVLPEADALPSFTRKPAVFMPREGMVEPLRVLAFLRSEFARLGGVFAEGTASLAEGGIAVDGAFHAAGTVVLTTGARPELAPEGLQPVRGQAFLVRLAGEDRGAVPTVVRSSTAYFVPRLDGTVYIGATEEWPGAIAQTADELWRDAERLLPCLGRAEILRRLEGFRPFVSRLGPLIARDKERADLVRAQGHHRNGILLAPLTAEAVEDLVV